MTASVLFPPDIESRCDPVYPHRHAGTLIVAGTAWCMENDLTAARRLRPQATVMGIRRTAEFTPVDMLFSIDREALAEPLRIQQDCYGRPRYGVHSLLPPGGNKRVDYPHIDWFWARPGPGQGTSAWTGALLGLLMGFEEVILAGAPLDVGLYHSGLPAPTFASPGTVAKMRIGVLRDRWAHPAVRSMSGWTQSVLGAPD